MVNTDSKIIFDLAVKIKIQEDLIEQLKTHTAEIKKNYEAGEIDEQTYERKLLGTYRTIFEMMTGVEVNDGYVKYN